MPGSVSDQGVQENLIVYEGICAVMHLTAGFTDKSASDLFVSVFVQITILLSIGLRYAFTHLRASYISVIWTNTICSSAAPGFLFI